MATITIRNLAEEVKRQLRVRGARNGRSMEAEARAILSQAVFALPVDPNLAPQPRDEAGPFDDLVGLWRGRLSTAELMTLTRGDD